MITGIFMTDHYSTGAEAAEQIFSRSACDDISEADTEDSSMFELSD